MMGKRHQFTKAQIERYVAAARAADPSAVIELVTDAGTVRILPDSAQQQEPDNPFDKWKSRRNEGQA
ncbi:MAG: hypothetical protein HWE21_06810 [Cytophagia bacterium]|uniref:hypothetical protein n=1 Tax=Salipiger sp. HF18 TaxID=2721557 RepID=UPI00142D30DB|nr:hypothetical protein [Salipiger sp. HF18]NIY97981.1 hypothetical protein [Salipiger sp. HF18]NVK84014.1 hypothetical protein [Cytophagia bacterium]